MNVLIACPAQPVLSDRLRQNIYQGTVQVFDAMGPELGCENLQEVAELLRPAGSEDTAQYDILVTNARSGASRDYERCVGFLRRLRAVGFRAGVIVLTDGAQVEEACLLSAGADYCVPVADASGLPHPVLLPAIIHAVKRKSATGEPKDDVVAVASLHLSVSRFRLTNARTGAEVRLTKREALMMEVLMRHPDIGYARERLLCHLYGSMLSDECPDIRMVDTRAARIRQKLKTLVGAEDTERACDCIESVRGSGYALSASVVRELFPPDSRERPALSVVTSA